MRNLIQRPKNNRRGATAVEYALIVSLIAVASISSMATLGAALSDAFGNVAIAVEGQAEGSGAIGGSGGGTGGGPTWF